VAQSWNNFVLFRCTDRRHVSWHGNLAQKIEAENRMRELLEDSGLPQPEHVEYGYTCIRLFFNQTKQVVVIDIDEPQEGEGGADADA
jgi:hypothetical protein